MTYQSTSDRIFASLFAFFILGGMLAALVLVVSWWQERRQARI
jgi:hypothetical protein